MQNLAIRNQLKLGYSLLWLKHGFITFREKPIQFFVLEIITSILTFLPFIGAFLGPLLIGRFMDCVDKVDRHQELKMSELLRGIFNNKLLLRLSMLNFSLNAIILLIQYFIDGNTSGGLLNSTLLITMLIIPSIMLTMSMWLSPAICLFNNDVEPKQAMWLSIKSCFYNLPLLLAFSILIAAISLLVTLPLFYLWLTAWDNTHSWFLIIPLSAVVYIICMVWFAILNITTYLVYRTVIYRKQTI
jgi:hypothetical protein